VIFGFLEVSNDKNERYSTGKTDVRGTAHRNATTSPTQLTVSGAASKQAI
jgi:hypothetical protein